MELAKGGELFDKLLEEGCLSEREAARIITQVASTQFVMHIIIPMLQVLEAVHDLHSRRIVHRDLKPENILMADDSDTAGLKIVDFGLSKIIGPNETSLDPFGTLSYVAPEVLLQKPSGKEVDYWSLGIITYLLLSRVLPFDDEDDKEIARQTIQDAADFNFPPWERVSQEAKAEE